VAWPATIPAGRRQAGLAAGGAGGNGGSSGQQAGQGALGPGQSSNLAGGGGGGGWSPGPVVQNPTLSAGADGNGQAAITYTDPVATGTPAYTGHPACSQPRTRISWYSRAAAVMRAAAPGMPFQCVCR
jgi:hypothetical protein